MMRGSISCCLPTPLTLVCGESLIILLLVHQPAYPSIWPAAPSLQRGGGGVHKSRGDNVGAVEEMVCVAEGTYW